MRTPGDRSSTQAAAGSRLGRIRPVLVCAAAGVLAAAPLYAQEGATEEAIRTHVVRRGDTLWDLARSYLSDPFLWPEIFRLNTDLVQNPDLIRPNERLRIPGAAGAPGMDADEAAGAQGGEGAAQDARTVFYRPNGQPNEAENTLRFEADLAQLAFPEGVHAASGVLARDSEIAVLGRLHGVVESSVVPMRLSVQIQPHMRVKVAAAREGALVVGDEIQFVRIDRQIKPYGQVYLPTGTGRVEAVSDDIATIVVKGLFGAMQVGDVAVAAPRFPLVRGVRAAPAAGVEARVVAFAEPHPLPSTEDRVFLDVGRRGGTAEGDEYEAFIPARVERGASHPELLVARLQVVRALEHTATARVTELWQPALAAGMQVRRVAKMP